jgi:hypothetical protein
MAKMTEKDSGVRKARRARARAPIIPREHGAWGLLLVPLFTGVVAGIASAHQLWALALFTAAALSLFWLRTPVESLLGSGTITAQTSRERRTAFIASVALAAVSMACLTGLMWRGRHLQLLVIGVIAASALAVQAVLQRLGRDTRMTAQLAGAVGLTSTAPAAYYLGTGHLDWHGIVLWVANWLFAWNQIHFVQLRIHAARTATFSEKFARGRVFFLAQPLMLVCLVIASLWRLVPPLVITAFVPALVRGTRWFFRGPEPLDIKRLGWSEMTHGVVFGILLAIAFLSS